MMEPAVSQPHPAPTHGAVVNPWLHRYAILVACATFCLIVVGAMVTSTGSGLAVPDWPTTFGHNMFTFPMSEWVGGIFFEHGHRLVASGVGLMTIGLALALWRLEPRRWMRRLGWLALFSVVLQGLLGGLTVRLQLPPLVSVLHASLAHVFLCLVVSIAVFTAPPRRGRDLPSPSVAGPGASRWCLLLTVCLFWQMMLGALMRHTDSGLAVPDFPLAYGQVIPDLSPGAIREYNAVRVSEYGLHVVWRDQIVRHLAHRFGAILVAVLLVGTGAMILRRYSALARIRRPILLLVLLLILQVALGAWTVLSGRHATVATAHVSVGTAMLILSLVLTFRAYELRGPIHAQAPGERACLRMAT